MHTHDKYERIFARGLALLAGYIDALGFLALGGVFVSFMSGNTTRFSVSVIQNGFLPAVLLPLILILLFVMGVVMGRILRHYNSTRPTAALLTYMTVCLLIGAYFFYRGDLILAAPCMAISMGAANNIFLKTGEVAIAITYMTGNLVRMGQHIAGHILGESQRHWWPYLLHWLSFVGGAILGSIAFHHLPGLSLAFGAGFCAVLCVMARDLDSNIS